MRDRGNPVGEQREAKAVERKVGHHDRQDQPEHEDGLAVALEARRVGDEPTVERVQHRDDDGDLDRVLEGGERARERVRERRRFAVADRDQLDLAQQQRHEAEEQHRVHHAGPPLAPHHPALQEAVDGDAAQARERRVPARLGLQCGDDPELSPGERREAGEGQQQQDGDRDRTHSHAPRIDVKASRDCAPRKCALSAQRLYDDSARIRLMHVNANNGRARTIALTRDSKNPTMQMQDSDAPRAPARGAGTSPLRAWVMASRPHTLTIGVNPVLVGCSLAWAETGRIDIGLMLLSMLGALLLQTGTNLDNDVSDFERGTDRAGRLGLPRATALGLLSAAPGAQRLARAASSSRPRSAWCWRGTAAGRSSSPGSPRRRQRWRIPAARGRSPTRRSATSSSGSSSASSR